MNIRLLRVFLLICLALPWGLTHARELKIIFSQYTPPYVFEKGDGIVVDIVREALKASGHKVAPVYVPIGRGFELFAEQRVDGTAIIRENSGLKANYSDDFMQYHNRAFSLKSRQFKLGKLADLKDKTVVAFQNASKYLGEDFGRVVAVNPDYKEMANQETQTLMLLLGRIDVAVMDESIFRFYREKLIAEGKAPRATEYEVFQLFPPTPYKTAFIDASIRDAFNRELAAMRRDGRYEAIYRKYIDEYFTVKQ
ncbi:MAG: transporter substrate-binding domain-containing protein [Rhodocyclaceae bacterium]|nr:transporter substrate-binding domain-containing protein [Rhodocyclaceae bacterium]MDZ4214494.1 transporter substrate-binding domain-containing protein [Rhodocyclaceae bacterium]